MMSQEREEYFNRPSGIARLWAGLLAGPLAWALSQQVGYLFVTLNCSYNKTLVLTPVMLLTLLVAVVGTFISWRNWEQTGDDVQSEQGGVIARSRFMSICGLILGGFSALAIIAEWMPIFFYRQCQR
jgi:hypothetical protein